MVAAADDELSVDLDAVDEVKKPFKKPVEPDIRVESGGESGEETDETPKLTPEDGLKKLQKQLDDERELRIAAERNASAAAEAEVKARTESHDNRLHLVNSGITTLNTQMDTLEARYAEALTAGDGPTAAKIQREMATNAAKLLQLENGKAALEKAPKPMMREPSDPVEGFVKTMSKPSADWVRAHREFALDEKKTRKMVRAHEDALDEGLKEDTPSYFAFIEKTLGIGSTDAPPQRRERVEQNDDVEVPLSGAAAATKGRSVAPVSAPVSRSGNGTGERKGTVRLTAAQVEAAEMTGVTPEEYARNLLSLKKDGRIN